jgi:hypothetical protein
MRYLPLDAHDWLVVFGCNRSCEHGSDAQAVAHARALGICDKVYVFEGDVGFVKSLVEDVLEVICVMFGDFSRDHSALAFFCCEDRAFVGEDSAGAINNAYSKCVRG